MKHKIWVTVAAIMILAAAAMAFVLIRRPDIRYLVSDVMVHLGTGADLKDVDEEILNLKKYPVGVFLDDERVRKEQSVMLINREFPLTEEFAAEISQYKESDIQMNVCMYEAYERIAAEVFEKFGQKLYVRSGYRTAKEQQEQAENHSDVAAAKGASEHQAGLALDVYVPQFAGMGFIKSPAGQWVNSNCWRYGFIIRYPYYGRGETEIAYEPWHLRYIGMPHAEVISQNQLTLESYLNQLESGLYYQYGEYLITKQSGDVLYLPEKFSEAVISEDNQGSWIITLQGYTS